MPPVILSPLTAGEAAGPPATAGILRSAATVATLLALSVLPAGAHHPHDVINSFALSPRFAADHTLFAASAGSLNLFLVSRDGGYTWESSRAGLRGPEVFDMVWVEDGKGGTRAIAALGGMGVEVSVDGGGQWRPLPIGRQVYLLAVPDERAPDGGVLLLAGGRDVYLSYDGGTTARRKMRVSKEEQPVAAIALSPGFVHDSTLAVAADGNALFMSFDAGESWRRVELPSPARGITFSNRFAEDRTIWLATFGSGVLVSTDAGESFVPAATGLNDPYVNEVALAPMPDGAVHLAAATRDSGLYLSGDGGGSWKRTPLEVKKTWQTDNHYTSAKFSPGYPGDGTIFCGTYEGLNVSNDDGRTWRECNITPTRMGRRIAFSPSFGEDGTIFGSGYGEQIAVSRDGGETWEFRNRDFKGYGCYAVAISPDFAADSIAIVGMGGGIRRSTNGGRDWSVITFNHIVEKEFGYELSPTYGVTFSPDFARDHTVFATCNRGEVFRSIDGGATWETLPRVAKRLKRVALSPGFRSNRTLYAGGAGIYRSTDGGDYFEGPITERSLWRSGLFLPPDFDEKGEMFAIFTVNGLMRSTDRGVSWTPCNPGPNGGYFTSWLALSPDFTRTGTMVAATLGGGIYRTDDRGVSWHRITPPDSPIRGVFSLDLSPEFPTDSTIAVGTYQGFWISRNAGASWEHVTRREVYDDERAPWIFRGEWSRSREKGSINYWVHRSERHGDEAELSFNGIGVRLFFAVGPRYGTAELSLDGEPWKTIDCAAAAEASGRMLAESGPLAAGYHTVVIRVRREPGRPGAGTRIGVDGAEVTFR